MSEQILSHEKSKVSTKADTWLGMFFLALGLAGLVVVNDFDLWNQLQMSRSLKNALATLVKREGQVRYKFSEGLFWQDARTQTPEGLLAGDSIFTGDEGRADLSLKNGLAFQLLPNSLIVLDPFELNGRGLRLESGGLKLNLAKMKDPVTVKVHGRAYEIRPDEASSGYVNVAVGDEVRITNEGSGKIVVKDKSDDNQKAVELGSQSALLASENGDLKINLMPFKPTYPVEREKILKTKQKPNVEFRWKPVHRFDPSRTEARIEIRGESNRVININPNSDVAQVDIPSGKYSWRMQARTVQGKVYESSWHLFSVQELKAPTLLSPVDGTVVPPEMTGKRTMVFRWKNAFDGFPSEVEVQERATGRVYKFTEKGTEKQLKVGPGKYSWRVRTTVEGMGIDDNETLVSSWYDFTIEEGGAKSPLLTEEKKAAEAPTSQATVERAPSAQAPKTIKSVPKPKVKIMPTPEVRKAAPTVQPRRSGPAEIRLEQEEAPVFYP